MFPAQVWLVCRLPCSEFLPLAGGEARRLCRWRLLGPPLEMPAQWVAFPGGYGHPPALLPWGCPVGSKLTQRLHDVYPWVPAHQVSALPGSSLISHAPPLGSVASRAALLRPHLPASRRFPKPPETLVQTSGSQAGLCTEQGTLSERGRPRSPDPSLCSGRSGWDPRAGKHQGWRKPGAGVPTREGGQG